MAYIALYRVNTNPQSYEEWIGFYLYSACINHFNQFFGIRNIGLGYAGCTAAVAVPLNSSYDAAGPFGQRFSVVYGSSRLFSGLDPDYNRMDQIPFRPRRTFANAGQGEHAEQTAIRLADSRNLGFWLDRQGCSHLYVDFNPCGTCGPWLDQRPENWIVHYLAPLSNQRPVVTARKRRHRETFGWVTEPRPSKRRRVR